MRLRNVWNSILAVPLLGEEYGPSRCELQKEELADHRFQRLEVDGIPVGYRLTQALSAKSKSPMVRAMSSRDISSSQVTRLGLRRGKGLARSGASISIALGIGNLYCAKLDRAITCPAQDDIPILDSHCYVNIFLFSIFDYFESAFFLRYPVARDRSADLSGPTCERPSRACTGHADPSLYREAIKSCRGLGRVVGIFSDSLLLLSRLGTHCRRAEVQSMEDIIYEDSPLAEYLEGTWHLLHKARSKGQRHSKLLYTAESTSRQDMSCFAQPQSLHTQWFWCSANSARPSTRSQLQQL